MPTTYQSPYGREIVLIVASDRISAFDYVLQDKIPGKGKYLTYLSEWWFHQLAGIVPHHYLSNDVPAAVSGHAMLAARLQMYPIECTVRGYLSEAIWQEYAETGAVCGNPLPSGIEICEQLPEPIFCPAKKARIGKHDENITFDTLVQQVGADNAVQMRQYAFDVYNHGAQISGEHGLILADTKLEFGAASDSGEESVVLGDEVLTPDSSHYWLTADYQPGEKSVSLDKELISSWLISQSDWDPSANTTPPALPKEIIAETQKRYILAVKTITGSKLFGID
ncbi:phosphoribosylaminoimidazole-succinocarboxamide synthase [Arcanobacterium hippocoleae]|uniref:Phosphoribosylaminoimidazole-succinocarboxamide synthase n=1 Tax=Arcanobacterium hippocoleae TaxID=149017 RepID=A0ABU1T2W8_9ACTO|nr:phosphoribosylaminoimidazole-succinocarboxamide synthase [Arcanobacterium hippocoleae]